MSGGRTKVAASNMPHAQPGVISSQHFLSLIISHVAVSMGGGQGTKPQPALHYVYNIYEHLYEVLPPTHPVCMLFPQKNA